ncbi:MAG: signal recognition particle-docking protein FtsY, partial [Alishewanella sp. 32-51-5]
MTKQNKLFSWLGFGKKPTQPEPTPEQAPEQASEQASEQTAEAAAIATPEQVAATVMVAPPVEAEAKQNVAAPQAPAESSLVSPNEPTATAESQAGKLVVEVPAVNTVPTLTPAAAPDNLKKPGFFARLKQGLAKTSQNLG